MELKRSNTNFIGYKIYMNKFHTTEVQVPWMSLYRSHIVVHGKKTQYYKNVICHLKLKNTSDFIYWVHSYKDTAV
jgi:hypothetical protein